MVLKLETNKRKTHKSEQLSDLVLEGSTRALKENKKVSQAPPFSHVACVVLLNVVL